MIITDMEEYIKEFLLLNNYKVDNYNKEILYDYSEYFLATINDFLEEEFLNKTYKKKKEGK